MATYVPTARWALRKLTGGSLINDIDAGFDALAEDVDPKLTPWSAGIWADRPAATKPGQRYYVTDLGYEVVADGTNWLLTGSVGVGELVETLRSADPPGGFLLLADGRSIVRATVPVYSAIIGGSSTNITLPDLRGRGSVAPSNMGGPNQTGNTRVQASAGAVLGEVAHTLTAAESGVNGNGATGGMNRNNPHNHGLLGSGTEAADLRGVPWESQPTASNTGAILATDINHEHALVARAADSAHNTVHPVVAVNKLIRVK